MSSSMAFLTAAMFSASIISTEPIIFFSEFGVSMDSGVNMAPATPVVIKSQRQYANRCYRVDQRDTKPFSNIFVDRTKCFGLTDNRRSRVPLSVLSGA